MHSALFYAIGVMFCCGMFLVGRAMRRAPSRALPVFTFGQEPMFGNCFGEKFCSIFGIIFLVFSVLGIFFYTVAIMLSFIQ